MRKVLRRKKCGRGDESCLLQTFDAMAPFALADRDRNLVPFRASV
jgi:hypothetical protein